MKWSTAHQGVFRLQMLLRRAGLQNRVVELRLGREGTINIFFSIIIILLCINFQHRWFILSDNCLFYFKSPSDVEPCGIIPLESIHQININKYK